MMSSTKKTKIQNFPIKKKLKPQDSTSLECLNSSLAQLAGELWHSSKMAKVTFCATWFFTKICAFEP